MVKPVHVSTLQRLKKKKRGARSAHMQWSGSGSEKHEADSEQPITGLPASGMAEAAERPPESREIVPETLDVEEMEAPTEIESVNVAIIGGALAGLATALALHRTDPKLVIKARARISHGLQLGMTRQAAAAVKLHAGISGCQACAVCASASPELALQQQ